MVRAEADRIAEIVDGKAGHYGVQINHAHALARGCVDEHVVQLGVVVRYAQRQFARAQSGQRHAAVGRVFLYKRNLGRAVLRAAHRVGRARRLEFGKAVFGIVEFFDRLKQRIGGIILQHALEPAKRLGRGIKQPGRFGRLQTARLLDKRVHAPRAARAVGKERLARPGAQNGHRLARGIAAALRDLSAQIVRYAHNVLHQPVRAVKRGRAHALQNVAHTVALFRLGIYAERIIDVSFAIAHRADDAARKIIRGQRLGNSVFGGICHRYASSHRRSGYSPSAVFCAMAATTTGLSA